MSKPSWLAACLVALAASTAPCHAASLRFCSGPDALGPATKDRLFRFGALIKDELERSGRSAVLISRSGLDLSRFGHRYSHAGISLEASDNTPWSVRQLYYACDESRPRLYDQGIAGFVLGTDEPDESYVSLVLLPADETQALERVALDREQSLLLLSANYSANAYPFSVQYQNCNQWVAEMLARAWRGDEADAPASVPPQPRAAAQAWLRSNGYQASVFEVGSRPLMWLANVLPWLHGDDHPEADLSQALYRVSMPVSVEAFVHARLARAERVELCQTPRHFVVHHGWGPIAAGCVAGGDDRVIELD